MKLIHKLVLPLLLAPALLPLAAHADEPGHHGAYLHALADLHVAHWLIEHRPGDNWVMGRNEQIALSEIDAATREITQLGADVGKDVYREERPDAHPDRRGRLHDAVEALERARSDVAQREDDPRVFGLQQHAMHRIEMAKHATEDAMRDAGY
ncbi:hypothetical protein CFter6_4328 [Collimonas fungivorans]|jgi:hypothetical protein|uniref:Uncharacterized protein n=1 Tax=Collimonas fungivorans TaxID=158899 RepID=A0A127PH25_9BURK|nr:hypothetical protein [Collimonas fungivorans]AMO96924.1 hypothetical protein CFter6_4328 [Collimonas fungivorans]